MTIKQALRAYLLTKASITALVGQRVYTSLRPQGSPLPAITITRISSGQEHDLDGAIPSAYPRIQIDSWAGSDVAADAVADAVRNVLDGFDGGLMGTVTVDVVIIEGQNDLSDAPIDGSDTSTYRIQQDFMVRFQSTQPDFQ